MIRKIYSKSNKTFSQEVYEDGLQLAKVNYDLDKANLKAFTKEELKALEKMDERFENNSANFFTNVSHQIEEMLI